MPITDLKNATESDLVHIIQTSNAGGTKWLEATAELQRRQLENLKKPHKPTFILIIVSALFAFVAAVASILALPQVQQAFFGSPKVQEKNKLIQSYGQQSQSSKPELQRK